MYSIRRCGLLEYFNPNFSDVEVTHLEGADCTGEVDGTAQFLACVKFP